MSMRLLRPSFNKGQAPSRKRYGCRERVGIEIQMTLEHVSSEIQDLAKTYNVAKGATSSKRMSQLRVYFDIKQTSAEFFSQKFEYQMCIQNPAGHRSALIYFRK